MGIFFEEAKIKPKLRQRFLEEIDYEKYRPFIKDVIYLKDEHGENIMETVPAMASDWLVNMPSTIRVSDYAFTGCSENIFYNILIPHEGLHAWQNYFEYDKPAGENISFKFTEGIRIFREKEITQEIAACRNQMDHYTFENCSQRFKKYTIDTLRFHEKLYENLHKQSHTQ